VAALYRNQHSALETALPHGQRKKRAAISSTHARDHMIMMVFSAVVTLWHHPQSFGITGPH